MRYSYEFKKECVELYKIKKDTRNLVSFKNKIIVLKIVEHVLHL